MTESTLRELLTDLSHDPAAQAAFDSDPAGYLSSQGHDLPGDLVSEAIVNVASGLPADVAEHLSAFTTANSPIPSLDGSIDDIDAAQALDGLHLLASSPALADGDPSMEEAASEASEAFGSGATEAAGPADNESVETEGLEADAMTDDDPSDGLDVPFDSVDAAVDPLDPTILDELESDDLQTDGMESDDSVSGSDPMDLDGFE